MFNRYLIVILRFHGDVLLTKPMIDNIMQNDPKGKVDLLVYKGTGSVLGKEKSISEIIEIESGSKKNIFSRIIKEINLWRKIRLKKYDYCFFLTTQWRVVPISWAIGDAKKAAVDDKKRRRKLWTLSFSAIFPEALENHIVKRNLSALETLGLKVFSDDLVLDSPHLDDEYQSLLNDYSFFSETESYCVLHPTSRKEKKLWQREKFAHLINFLLKKDLAVVVTSGPDTKEIAYVNDILNKANINNEKVLNLSGKTSLTSLAALIRGSLFFIGLDSVASHIAASVDRDSITLFGPSNPINWKPWSNKARIISKENLKDIEVEDVTSLIEELLVQ